MCLLWILTTSFKALQTIGASSGDVRGPSASLQFSLKLISICFQYVWDCLLLETVSQRWKRFDFDSKDYDGDLGTFETAATLVEGVLAALTACWRFRTLGQNDFRYIVMMMTRTILQGSDEYGIDSCSDYQVINEHEHRPLSQHVGMLILNLPTNIYKSSNNKKYQQISTNLPTI